MKTIKASLTKWKSIGGTLRMKTAIINSYTLSKLTYHLYVNDLHDSTIEQINKAIKKFLWGAGAPAMSLERAVYDRNLGGLGLWDLRHREIAQKVWIMNRFFYVTKILKSNTMYSDSWNNQINTGSFQSQYLKDMYHNWSNVVFAASKSCKHISDHLPLLNKDGSDMLSLKEIYNIMVKSTKVIDMKEGIPLTNYQDIIRNYRGLNYSKLFSVINSIKNLNGKNTMFRLAARCLPGINYMHNKPCKMCSEDCTADPYSHLFFKCKMLKKKVYPAVKSVISHLLPNIKIDWSNNLYNNIIKLHDKGSCADIEVISIALHQLWVHISGHLFSEHPSTFPIDAIIQSIYNAVYHHIKSEFNYLSYSIYNKIHTSTTSKNFQSLLISCNSIVKNNISVKQFIKTWSNFDLYSIIANHPIAVVSATIINQTLFQ